MKSLLYISPILFLVTVLTDARAHDLWGAIFWSVATGFYAGLALRKEEAPAAMAWVRLVLVVMAAAVLFIRLGLGYQG